MTSRSFRPVLWGSVPVKNLLMVLHTVYIMYGRYTVYRYKRYIRYTGIYGMYGIPYNNLWENTVWCEFLVCQNMDVSSYVSFRSFTVMNLVIQGPCLTHQKLATEISRQRSWFKSQSNDDIQTPRYNHFQSSSLAT